MKDVASHRGMHRQIRSQLVQIALVYVGLGALIGWQHHFIWTGLQSNPYLNGIIISVFLLGTGVTIRALLNLRNETRAFAALEEVYSDIGLDRERSARDPLWRYRRSMKPGLVFSTPRLLGHIFELTFHELQRTKHMRISVATMQNLVAAIDHRLAQERSLLVYLSGLSVFLGLIGTFIGLMEMVASVGGIIGGLANAEAADTAAVKRLIKDLEAPLTGMALGFSASLFGLFGSLVIGLVARYSGNAAQAIRHEFEAWLSGISQITDDGERTKDPETGEGVIAHAVLSGLAESGRSFDRAVESIRNVLRHQTEQSVVLRHLAERFDVFAAEHVRLKELLDRSARIEEELSDTRREQSEALRSIEGVVAAGFDRLLGRIDDRHAAVAERLSILQQNQDGQAAEMRSRSDWLHAQVERVQAAMRQVGDAQGELAESVVTSQQEVSGSLRRFAERTAAEIAAHQESHGAVMAQHGEVLGRLRDGQVEVKARLERLAATTTPGSELVEATEALRRTTSDGLADLARVTAETSRVMAAALDRLVEGEQELRSAIHSGGDVAGEIRSMAQGLQDRLSDGFVDISRSIEAAFLLNAELIGNGVNGSKTANDDTVQPARSGATGND
jgi:hypothetical protein